MSAHDWIRHLFGKRPGEGWLTTFFSARTDETGTDGRSQFVIVAGGVSPPAEWDKLEIAWNRLLESRRVSFFHTKEFRDREGDFADWGNLKRRDFVKAQEKIIRRRVVFQFAVAVERETHARIKKEWRGVKGFKADSDYGLCFRIARFLVCEQIAELFSPAAMVQFIVEDRPFAADAGVIYQQIKRTCGAKYSPARFAGMMAGFASVPKGVLRSLEAADYLAGRAISDLEDGTFISTKRQQQMSLLMDYEFMNDWNERMVKEREHRQAHSKRYR